MFVTDDETKAALEQWAKDEKLTVSSLCAQVMRKLLTDKGYLKQHNNLLSRCCIIGIKCIKLV